MNTTTAILICIALLLVGSIAWWYSNRRRSKTLRSHFGPEYDRLVRTGDRRHAEAELEDRARRVRQLSIRSLKPGERDRYAELWRVCQARFVDDPGLAVSEADSLVEEVMRVRGYPVGDFEHRVADVSVDHPRLVENYRAAHEIALHHRDRRATTEDLRRAVIHYRSLFEDLLEESIHSEAQAS